MDTEAIPSKRFQLHDMDAAAGHRHTFAREVALA